MIPFLTALDERYIFPTKIMLKSLDCNLSTQHDFYIIVRVNKSKTIIRDLESLVLHNLKIKFLIFTEKTNKSTEMKGLMHFSNAATYRLYASSLLPPNIDEVIYLDNDILIRKPISIDNFPKNIFAAYVEPNPANECLDISNYFNSGVFRTNLNYWREFSAETRMLDFLKSNQQSIYKDQDALNYFFAELNTEPLDVNLNFMPDKISKSKSCKIDPTIVHYAGHKKPWKRSTLRTKYIREWQEFAKLHFGYAIIEKTQKDYLKKLAYLIGF